MRLRLLRVLDSASTTFLGQPEKLKYLLCPVVAQGKAEQERFYELFDKYWEEISQPWEPTEDPILPKRNIWKVLRRAFWLLLAAGIVAFLFLPHMVIFHSPTIPFAEGRGTTAYKEAWEFQVVLGETIIFENEWEKRDSLNTFDSKNTKYYWQLFNSNTTDLVAQDSKSVNWSWKAQLREGDDSEKDGLLIAYHVKDNRRDTFEFGVRVLCKNVPVIDTILVRKRVSSGKVTLHFEAVVKDDKNVTYTWDFGDDSTAQGRKVSHVFKGAFSTVVWVTAAREDMTGYCQDARSVNVGEEIVLLAAKPLWKEAIKPIVQFSWGTWIVLGLIGLAVIFFWIRWATRKPPPPVDSEQLAVGRGELQADAPDKAPYFIPFRSQEPFVRVGRELFRLGDVLRIRQEGLRRELDVPSSVRATVAEGGFPNLKTALSTVPTEYLFLVDEQAAGSHQAEVFKFLVNLFKQREVLCEVFSYKTEMHRFWNDQHPDGISAEQLQRQFGFHRLIVLGDGHGLLDAGAGLRAAPGANGAPQFLKPAAVDFLKHWKRRLLLTPVPLASWTFREGALHDLFAIFPAGTSGLVEATKFLERTLDEEDRPTFANWCERLVSDEVSSENGNEPDINYRTWRTAVDHRDYLENRPVSTQSADRSLPDSGIIPHTSYLIPLYRWLCALAVYPKPEWSLTIAIGRALGTETNYDNLLILSRIPWLQTGDLTQRLRKELLADLDPEAEKLARETVKQELEAVQPLIVGSHAGLHHQSQLAIQNFALDPNDPAAQETLRQLLEQNLLTPREINDLNQAVSRIEPAQPASQTAIQPSSHPTIQSFLVKNEEKQEPPQKHFFTKEVRRAVAATLVFLLLCFVAWNLSGTDRLYRWVFGEEPSASVAHAERPMRDRFFVKENLFRDSAVLYNNLGVDAYREVFGMNDTSAQQAVIFDSTARQRILSNFRRAIELSKNQAYPLANSNMGKVYFNAGVSQYNYYLKASQDTTLLYQAVSNFSNAVLVRLYGKKTDIAQDDSPANAPVADDTPVYIGNMSFDSTKLDGMHGFGLAQFYLGRIDSALVAHQFLRENTGGQFFDTLSMFPHLDRLLYPEKYEDRRTIRVQVLDVKTGKPIASVLVTAANFQGSTDRDGSFSVELQEGERRDFIFSKKGHRSLRQALSAEDGAVTLRLQPLPDKVVLTPTVTNKFRFDGVVRDAKTGKTIPDVMIAFTDAERDGDYGTIYTNERGQFLLELENLPDQVFFINVAFYKDGYVAKTSRTPVKRFTSETSETKLEPVVEQAPLDSDGDGVPDAQDKCPNEKGDPNLGGCPPEKDVIQKGELEEKIDTDKDGVPDAQDGCPEVFGSLQNNGCPESKEQKLPPNEDEEPVQIAKAARKPVFKGCESSNRNTEIKCTENKLADFVRKRLRYPDQEIQEQQKPPYEGTIVVLFVIEKDGSVTNVQCQNEEGSSYCQEAVRVVKTLPKFKPGESAKGEKIRVAYLLPVRFSQK